MKLVPLIKILTAILAFYSLVVLGSATIDGCTTPNADGITCDVCDSGKLWDIGRKACVTKTIADCNAFDSTISGEVCTICKDSTKLWDLSTKACAASSLADCYAFDLYWIKINTVLFLNLDKF